jgi:sugar phosphate isomerase/epimerase
MANCGKWPVGVCSWSLQLDVEELAQAMTELNINHVHLAVRPALGDDGQQYLSAVRKQNWNISCTMLDFPQEDYSTLETIKITGGIVPDDHWPQNRRLFEDAVKVTAELGVEYLLMHAGFIDTSSPEYTAKFAERIDSLADVAAGKNVVLLLETGQETAEELKQFLEELNHQALAVNFDPANMILYDKGDPIKAVRTLARWIKHVHVKDANRTAAPGTWGTEVPWGTGQVGTDAFLTALIDIGFNGALAVEREAGDNRLGDIKQAIDKLCNSIE